MSLFKGRVLDIVKMVTAGKVVSYGQVALMAGFPRAALQVGWVLHEFGATPGVPWWRVINGQGRISTSCVEHTADMQKRLLEKEGVKVSPKLTIDIEKYRFIPDPCELKKLQIDEDLIAVVMDKYCL